MRTSSWKQLVSGLFGRQKPRSGIGTRRNWLHDWHQNAAGAEVEKLEVRTLCSASNMPAPQLTMIHIGSRNQTSDPKNFTPVQNQMFFTADDGVHGRNLWKTDGTDAGTTMVSNFSPATPYGSPENLCAVNDTLFFSMPPSSGVHGLWKTDGTTEGTVLVHQIGDLAEDFDVRYFSEVNGTLYFSARTKSHGIELWKSDGTRDGTQMVADIAPGSNHSVPRLLTNVNGTLFFYADDGISGQELWKSDGTAAGTSRVADINPGMNSSLGNNIAMVNVNGTLFFQADDGVHGFELWKSDGTTGGTKLVADIESNADETPYEVSSNPTELTNFNGWLFFIASSPSSYGELWRSDGTEAGTTQVLDIHPGRYGSGMHELTVVNDTLFFTANDGTTGRELWKSDGTAQGTSLVADLTQGPLESNPMRLVNVDGTLFFGANQSQDGTNTFELWKSDGTASGTVRIEGIRLHAGIVGNEGIAHIGNTIVVSAKDDRHGLNSFELWKSNGTVAGTSTVKDLNTKLIGSQPRSLTDVEGTLYFVANDGITGDELWKSDGSIAGTALVADLRTGSRGGDLTNLVNVDGTLFFSADDGIHGKRLWKSDGSASGTVMVSNVAQSPHFLTNVSGTLYFSAGSDFGGELWKSDGTAAGTVQVADIVPGPGSSQPCKLKDINGMLYFSGNDATGQMRLWRTDGTALGTIAIADLGVREPQQGTRLEEVNGTIFFTAFDPLHGLELWKTDGTKKGTQLVSDILAGSKSSIARLLGSINGQVLFSASTFNLYGFLEEDLWKSDGTAAGTKLVVDFFPFPGYGSPRVQAITAFDGALAFGATSGFGNELWRTDGTAAGTKLIADINPGSGLDGNPTLVTNVNEQLFFRANDSTNFQTTGYTLWTSDGTAIGTRPVLSSTGGRIHDPTELVESGGRLFAVADMEGSPHGDNLWVLTKPADDQPDIEVSGNQQIITDGDTSPSNANFTDFGSVAIEDQSSRIFSIQNAGVAELHLTGTPIVRIEGANASEFEVTVLPKVSLSKSDFTTFQVTFHPSACGVRSAKIVIGSDDSDEPLFDFVIRGIGTGTLSANLPSAGGLFRILKVGNTIAIRDERGVDVVTPAQLDAVHKIALHGSRAADLVTIDASLVGFGRPLRFVGGDGADKLDASRADFSVTMDGGAGNDTLVGGSAADSFIGGVGLDSALGGAGNDLLNGDAGNDRLFGEAGNDRLDGSDGNDSLDGGAGDADTLTGGTGNDTLSGGSGRADMLLELINGSFTLTKTGTSGSLGSDSFTNFERVWLMGGDGNDSINANAASLAVTLNGGGGNDTLTGGTGNDLLQGDEGNDRLLGGNGNDTVEGDLGDDTLTGGTGNDSFNGGEGSDRVSESANANFVLTDTALVGVGNDSLADVETVFLIGGTGRNTLDASAFTIGRVLLNGGAGNDTLKGGHQADSLIGGMGNDSLIGNDGDDLMLGEVGNDSLLGGAGNDILLGGLGDDSLSGSTSLAASNSTDDGNDTLLGGAGRDRLFGGVGSDVLSGDEGNDTLIGDAGTDSLFGGTGTDSAPSTDVLDVTSTDGIFADTNFFDRLNQMMAAFA